MNHFCTHLRSVLGLLMLIPALCGSGKATAQAITQMAKLIGSGTSGRMADDSFGYSVSVYRDYAVVGAPYQDYDAAGGTAVPDAGAAYIFYRTGGAWVFQQKLVAADRQANDHFGLAVFMAYDYVVVGAPGQDYDAIGANQKPDAGAVYAFKRSGLGWSQQGKLVAADRQVNDQFGWSLSVDHVYNTYAVAGAPGQDYDATGTGTAVNDAGAAYVFDPRGSGSISVYGKLVASDRQANDHFGTSVSIYQDYVLVGAPDQDYDAAGANRLTNAGATYGYGGSGTSRSQLYKQTPADRHANDNYGASIAMFTDLGSRSQRNSRTIVGAPGQDFNAAGTDSLSNAGATYLYGGPTGMTKLVATDRHPNDRFGASVSTVDGVGMVGAPGQDFNAAGADSLSNAGAIYLYGSGVSIQGIKLVAADRQAEDGFGTSVAIDGTYILAGGPGQDYDATGGNSNTNAGAAYIFKGASAYVSVSRYAAPSGSSITLVPQPVQERFTITTNNPSLEGSTATVLDIQGREVTRFTVRDGVRVEVSTWVPGWYLIRLADGSTLRLVKH